MNTDQDVAQAVKQLHWTKIVESPTLHPSTSPEGIAEAQRREIRKYLRGRRPRPDVSEISEAVCLPKCVVLRRLAEIVTARERARSQRR